MIYGLVLPGLSKKREIFIPPRPPFPQFPIRALTGKHKAKREEAFDYQTLLTTSAQIRADVLTIFPSFTLVYSIIDPLVFGCLDIPYVWTDYLFDRSLTDFPRRLVSSIQVHIYRSLRSNNWLSIKYRYWRVRKYLQQYTTYKLAKYFTLKIYTKPAMENSLIGTTEIQENDWSSNMATGCIDDFLAQVVRRKSNEEASQRVANHGSTYMVTRYRDRVIVQRNSVN